MFTSSSPDFHCQHINQVIRIKTCFFKLLEIKKMKRKEVVVLCVGRQRGQKKACCYQIHLAELITTSDILCHGEFVSQLGSTPGAAERKQRVQTCARQTSETAVTILIGCDVRAYSDSGDSSGARAQPVCDSGSGKRSKPPSKVQSQETYLI